MSLYYIPNEYVPVLIKKNLFKNSEMAVKKFKNIKIPLYVLNDFEVSTKKPPNSFIIFRNEIFKNVKNEYPNSTSREISKIIGNLWNRMKEENKLPYLKKANELKNEYKRLYPNHKYKKVLRNLKQREYVKRKDINNNPQFLLINNILQYEIQNYDLLI